jgi:protein-disulfide isomerase
VSGIGLTSGGRAYTGRVPAAGRRAPRRREPLLDCAAAKPADEPARGEEPVMNRRPVTGSRCAIAAAAVSMLFLLGPGGALAQQPATPPAAAPAEPTPASRTLALVAGKPVTEADVEQRAADSLKQIRREYERNTYQMTEQTLNQIVEDRLLEVESAARGVTREQLLAEIKPGEVTDADVDAFYEQNKAQIPVPKEQVVGQIRNYLQQQKQADARRAFFDGLRAKHGVSVLLEPPRVTVAATGPSRGPVSAPVTIVMFTDFQCPYCARVRTTLDQVQQRYGDKVRLVVRQFPLAQIHPQAQKAAEASLCANDQGKFWPLYDAMFTNQKALAVDALKAKAAELSLDAAAFAACLDGGKYAATVQADAREGMAAGVTGTPAMFVNGRFISGSVPLDQITAVIDDELRRAAPAPPATS